MTGSFDYFFQEQPTDALQVDDIGNCCILANDDLNNSYCLIIRTEYGFTRTLFYGPWSDPMLPTYLSCEFNQFEYNERKLSKIIYKFLNNGLYHITQARLCEQSEIAMNIINPFDYFVR